MALHLILTWHFFLPIYLPKQRDSDETSLQRLSEQYDFPCDGISKSESHLHYLNISLLSLPLSNSGNVLCSEASIYEREEE